MIQLHIGSNRWMATLVAMLFAVQAALVAFPLGAEAAPVERDQFGNVLCTTGVHATEGGAAPHDGKGHGDKPDCCRLGCLMGDARWVPPDAVPLMAPRIEAARRLGLAAEDRMQPCGRSGERWARAPPAIS